MFKSLIIAIVAVVAIGCSSPVAVGNSVWYEGDWYAVSSTDTLHMILKEDSVFIARHMVSSEYMKGDFWNQITYTDSLCIYAPCTSSTELSFTQVGDSLKMIARYMTADIGYTFKTYWFSRRF